MILSPHECKTTIHRQALNTTKSHKNEAHINTNITLDTTSIICDFLPQVLVLIPVGSPFMC